MADFSRFGAHLVLDHVSRFDLKVPHFSRYDPRVWQTLATGALTRRSTGVRWAACTPWFAVTVRGPLLILEKAAAFEHHS